MKLIILFQSCVTLAGAKCIEEFSFLKTGKSNKASASYQAQSIPVSRTIHVEFQSRALGRTARVNVTLPAGFTTSGRRAPVAFFLHGRGGQSAKEGAFTNLRGEEAMNELLKSGECKVPFVVVSPYDDLNSYWREGPKSGKHIGTETLITKELLEILQSCGSDSLDFQTKPAIGGLSAGGNASLYYGEKYSDIFGQVYALSPVFRGDADNALEPEDRIAFGKGHEFCEQDIVCRYMKLPKEAGKCPYPVKRLKVEVAIDDAFYNIKGGVQADVVKSTRHFFNRLKTDCPGRALVPTLQGGHSDDFFRPGLKRMLSYFCEGFSRNDSSMTSPPLTQPEL